MAEEELNCKIVLVGESGVGKTSIISQYIENEFTDKLLSTTGATFSTKTLTVGTKALAMEIWDTIGQEKYRSLTRMFYKEAVAAVLVYDITRKDSFDEIKNYWLEEVRNNAPENCILIICGNKNDLYLKEQIDENTAKEYATQNNALFFLTSAKDAGSVNAMFLEIGKKYVGDTGEENPIEEKTEKNEVVQITKETADKKKKKKCC